MSRGRKRREKDSDTADGFRINPFAALPIDLPASPATEAAPPADPLASLRRSPVIRMRMERKGRGGKTVTVLYELPGTVEAVAELARRLKRRLGVGGTAYDTIIELQGDVRRACADWLESDGFRVKGPR